MIFGYFCDPQITRQFFKLPPNVKMQAIVDRGHSSLKVLNPRESSHRRSMASEAAASIYDQTS